MNGPFNPYRSLAAILFCCLILSSNVYADRSLMWGFALDGYPITDDKLHAVEGETGIRPDIVVFFLQWPEHGGYDAAGFPRESLEAIWKRGVIPCITWEPMYYEDGKEVMISYERLLKGEYDRYIRRFAEGAARWGKPVMIRFAHEMNIKRYHWGTGENEYGPKSPSLYKKMFRYIVDRFRKTGAGNVLWVFCPNAESVPNTSYDPSASWNTLSQYYPGDRYVDVLGVDGYNWGTTQTKEKHGWDSRWRTFEEIFGPPSGELRSLAPSKPIIVFETATTAHGGNKAEWIKEAVNTAGRLGIEGIVWFQSNKELDWRINTGGDRSYTLSIQPGPSRSQEWIGRFKRNNQ
ncbi:MAG TPA: glycosyl hydrolase [Syntrophorhabdaceae bacterium]|nr:glycosyl hydrolase [Syntrophorhabdaceae bacterium]